MPTTSAPQWSPTSRPRLLAPVLSRGPRCVQVGVDPPAAVLVDEVDSAALAALLSQVDGSRSRAELDRLADDHGLDPVSLDLLLADLSARGLLADAPATPPQRSEGRVRLIGAGPIGRQLGDLLAGAGVGTLVLHDPRPTAGDTSRAEELRQRLRERHPVTIQVANHWSKPEHRVDVTVLATDALEPDRAISEALVRDDQVHLVVRPALHGAVVGPAVRPGATPCLRCLDLTRGDRDPHWPELVRQLGRHERELSPPVATWAAVTACRQVLALLDGSEPETAGTTLELDARAHRALARPWTAHPSCGCQWGVRAEWGP